MALSTSLEEVLITAQLLQRQARRVDPGATNQALLRLLWAVAKSPSDVWTLAAEAALELCQAQSVVITLLERVMGRDFFRCEAAAGELLSIVGLAVPRHGSASELVIEHNSSLLLAHPELLFSISAQPAIVEALVTPIYRADGKVTGALWIAAHEAGRQFDMEDVRNAVELARFMTSAWTTLTGLGYAQTRRFCARPPMRDKIRRFGDASEDFERLEIRLPNSAPSQQAGYFLRPTRPSFSSSSRRSRIRAGLEPTAKAVDRKAFSVMPK